MFAYIHLESHIYNVHLISYQTELCLYRVMLAVFLAVCRTIFTNTFVYFFQGLFFIFIYKLPPLLPLLKRNRIWHIFVKKKIRTKLKVHA